MTPLNRLLRACAGVTLLGTLCATAQAASVPLCHKHPEKPPQEALTLDAMIQCQDEVLRALMQEYSRKRGRSMSADAVAEIQEFQRREMREFLQAHPDRTLIDEERRMDPETEAKLQDAEKEPQGLIGMLASWFGGLKGQIEAFFHQAKGGAVPPGNPEAAKALELTQKGMRRVAEKAGTVNADGSVDTAATLGHSVKQYNEELDANIDPSMKKFFKKPGEKAD